MFYGYCCPDLDGWHTPKVSLPTAEAIGGYVTLQHRLFREIIITDDMDCCVMHVRDHIARVPQADGTFQHYDLARQWQPCEPPPALFAARGGAA
jgi:hypothetical protein